MPESSPHPAEDAKPAFSGTIGVLRISGVPIRLHFTFLLLIVFLVFIGVGGKQSAVMTALYVAGLFTSVLLHEMGHSLVARRYGIRTLEIVMFPIGGLARLDRQPRVSEELWIALAGPAVNLLLAGLAFAWVASQGRLEPMERLLDPSDSNLAERLAVGNLMLAAFNLLPAYPMDGGRVLRSILGRWKTEEEATRTAAGAGQLLSIGMGLFGLLSGNFMLVFIALFVYLGAAQEGAAAASRSLTVGFPVRSAMITDFRSLAHGDTIRDAGSLLLATSQHDFPVVLGNQVLGLLSRAGLIRAMLTDGPDTYVSSAMDRDFHRLSPDMELSQALASIPASGQCALVMEDDKLVGLLTAENVAEFMMLRQAQLFRARQTPLA